MRRGRPSGIGCIPRLHPRGPGGPIGKGDLARTEEARENQFEFPNLGFHRTTGQSPEILPEVIALLNSLSWGGFWGILSVPVN
jgi:hypothetical protein